VRSGWVRDDKGATRRGCADGERKMTIKALRRYFAPDRDAVRKALWVSMTGLYFPAVVGTGLVFLLLLCSHVDTWWFDFRFYFGFLFVCFFSFSFYTLINAGEGGYRFEVFFYDLIESIFVFFAFGFLGLYEAPQLQPRRVSTYLLFAGVILVENLWAYAVRRRRDNVKFCLSIAAIVLLLITAYYLRHIWKGADTKPFNVITPLALYMMFGFDVLYSFRRPAVTVANNRAEKLAVIEAFELIPERTDQLLTLLMAHRAHCLGDETEIVRQFEILRSDADAKVLVFQVYEREVAFDEYRNRPATRDFREEIAGIVENVSETRYIIVD
jgi:quinol monooxygenase YgiN